MSTLNQLLNTTNLDLSSLIFDMPGYLLIKDLNSIFLSGNTKAANCFGIKHPDDLVGLTDYTINHSLAEIGQFFVNLDRELIKSNGTLNGIYAFPFEGKIAPFYFNKQLLSDIAGNHVAIYSHANECKDPILLRMIDRLITTHPIENWKNQTKTSNCFTFNKDYPDLQLSSLEQACLFYLIRNKSISEMANMFQVEKKIIHECVAHIQFKLNAQNTKEILDIALEKNYVNIVPKKVFDQLYTRDNVGKLPAKQHTTTRFTAREMDCIKLLLAGNKIKDIAHELHLSPRTVETHMNHLKKKLSCRDKCALVMRLKDIF